MEEEYRGACCSQDDERQYYEKKTEFEAWLYSNEIQGDFTEACKIAKIDPKKSSREDLFYAFVKQ